MMLPLPTGIERHTLRLSRRSVKTNHPPAENPTATVVLNPGYIGSKEDYRFLMPLLTAEGYDS
ncbi:MAG: hypothetical protein ABIS86_24665 [Streptosporangiaceae bacterium]